MIRLTGPHLTVYRPYFSTILSILYRLTGIFLIVAFLCFMYFYNTWLYSVYFVYLAKFLVSYYSTFFLSAILFLLVLCVVEHLVFGSFIFEVPMIRPAEYENLDEFDMAQLYYLFVVKCIFVVLATLVFTTLILYFF